MTKAQVLEQIALAEKSHKEQVEKSELLVMGLSVKKERIILNQRECGFGKWFYGNEEMLKKKFGVQLFGEMERLHEQWHDENHKIYDIYFAKEKQGLFGWMGSKKKSIGGNDKDRAKAYLDDLKSTTKLLLQKIDLLRKRTTALPAEQFEGV